LLQKALSNPGDVEQIESYLEPLSQADPTFKYRILDDAKGNPTGYVWQTGVMRMDFERYGSTLFVDRLGRPLNNKGWPLMTIAMLSGAKKVCIPCEAIVISERIEAYAWMIRATVEMTPGVNLTDIRVIYGDGILGGESLLHHLGITDSCKIILDHHHLLSDDIGTWPKKFGQTWAQVKENCLQLVKTYEKDTYNFHFDCIRATVQHSRDLTDYVLRKIHSKRHLFANHLQRQGNASAEANHSSIRRRLGVTFYQSPVRLIEALLKRHNDITNERSKGMVSYRLQSMAKASKMANGNEKRALLALNSWGMELFQSSAKHSKTLDMTLQSDGKFAFAKKSDPDHVLLKLDQNATKCSCTFWNSYGLQCSHLLLLHQVFTKNLCSRRWLKESGLQALTRDGSVVDTTGEDGSLAGKADDGSNHGAVGDPGSGIASMTGAVGDENQLVRGSLTVVRQMQPSDVHRLTREPFKAEKDVFEWGKELCGDEGHSAK
jgi:hypothetical protein